MINEASRVIATMRAERLRLARRSWNGQWVLICTGGDAPRSGLEVSQGAAQAAIASGQLYDPVPTVGPPVYHLRGGAS